MSNFGKVSRLQRPATVLYVAAIVGQKMTPQIEIPDVESLYSALTAFEIAHVLLDFDGVVVNSEPLRCASYASVLHSYGISLSAEQFKEYVVGKSERVVLETIASVFGQSIDDADFSSARKPIVQALFDEIRDVNWFVRPLLNWCSQRNVDVRIVTAGPRQRTEVLLERFDLLGRIASIHTLPEQPLMTSKAQMIQSLITDSPVRYLVIEDSRATLKAAAEMGTRTVRVVHELSDEDDMIANGIVRVRSNA